jgi:aryl-alcohol dehydrogenase-like predicted oxidoreductase
VSAAAVKDRLAYTLRRLGTDYVDIYRPARLNPDIPIEETVGAVKEMIDDGYVRQPDRELSAGDFRGHSPRFQGDNLDANLRLVEALRAVAEEQGVTVAQVAIAWVLSRGDDIVPLVGARTRARLAESLGALPVTLTPRLLARIEAAVPAEAVAGSRYDAVAMAHLDSET